MFSVVIACDKREAFAQGSEVTKQSSLLWSWIASRSSPSGAYSRDPVARNDGELSFYLSCHFGSRFSMKAPIPSSASRAIMFSVITSAA
jgi:hypothetical protein